MPSLSPHSPPAFPALKPNTFYSSLPTTSILGIPTLAISPWERRGPGRQDLRGLAQGPKGGHGPAWAKCSVGRKGDRGRYHVTHQLCALGQLELSSTPAPCAVSPSAT